MYLKSLDKQGIYVLSSVTKNDVIRFPAESASNNDVVRHNIHKFKTILLVFFCSTSYCKPPLTTKTVIMMSNNTHAKDDDTIV